MLSRADCPPPLYRLPLNLINFRYSYSWIRFPDEESAREEVVRAKEGGSLAYSKADVVVALSGWDSTAVRPTAEGSLRALKYLLVAEKDLPGTCSNFLQSGFGRDF